MSDLVVGDVEDAERDVGVQTRNLGEGIVRDVEFLEGGEGGEVGDAGEAVGLDGEDLEMRERREILENNCQKWKRPARVRRCLP